MKLFGMRIQACGSTGTGKSSMDSRTTCFCSVSTSGRGSCFPVSRPGSSTTASPARRPEGTTITSPGLSFSTAAAAAARREAEFCRDSSASRSDRALRNPAYSSKSPRWQVIASLYPSSASRLRLTWRVRPTTARSAWNWAKELSSRALARAVPTCPTRLTAML